MILLLKKFLFGDDLNDREFFILSIAGSCITLGSVLLFSLRHSVLKTGIPVLLILISLWIHQCSSSDLPEKLIYAPGYVQAELQAADFASSSILTNLTAPNRVLCRVKRFRFSDGDHWKTCKNSYVLLQLSGNAKQNALRLGYGDEILAKGIMSFPEKPLIPGTFDYGNYLKLNDIDYIFRIDEMQVIRQGNSLKRKLFDIRDHVLARTVGRIRDQENRDMAMGILFGFRSGLSGDTKESFLKSGTIHILSVSGTHVGIFGLLMLLVFRFLPFSVRWIPALLFTGLYACCTGLNDPAVRAFLMYAVLLLHRGALLRTDVRNTLCFAAVILLLREPDSLFTAGFQYSFTTVIFLITNETC